MSTAYTRVIRYLRQESTWRGLVALLMAFGVTVDPDRANQIIAAGLTVIGLINTLKDK